MPKRKERETANNLDRRDRILGAAKKRFLHYGYKKTTIDEVALDTGMSKATIYGFFRNKEDILIQLLDREALDLQRALYRNIRDKDKPVEILEHFFLDAQDYLEENPFLSRILKRDPEIVSPRLMKHVFEIEDRYTGIVEEYVREALKQTHASFNPKVVAYVLYKVFEAFSYGTTLNGVEDIPVKDIRNFISYLLRTGLGG